MTKAKPSRWIRELLLDGLTEPSPFEKIGHQTFLKYDRITIEFKCGLLAVSFLWNGKPVFTLSSEYSKADVLNVEGLEGRMGIRMSD